MKKISIVLAGRCDNYGHDYIKRFKCAWTTNISRFEQQAVDYEIIFVDYNPHPPAYMHTNNELCHIFNNSRVTTYIVQRPVVQAEGLIPGNYYDYFAKNVGFRRINGELVISTNTDLIYSEQLISEIKQIANDSDTDEYFYRTRYRRDSVPDWIYANQWNRCQIFDCYRPSDGDHVICGCYSGDFIMFSKKSLYEKACGYNEMEQGHRTEHPQCGMDGEIAWNCYAKGLKMKMLDGHYFHIGHDKPSRYDVGYIGGQYVNKDNWGLFNYKQNQLADRVYEIVL